MSRMTNTQLVEENTKLRHHLAQLENEVERLQLTLHEGAALIAQLSAPKPARTAAAVFEFNPAVQGDFKRASLAAKEAGGVVRRCA